MSEVTHRRSPQPSFHTRVRRNGLEFRPVLTVSDWHSGCSLKGRRGSSNDPAAAPVFRWGNLSRHNNLPCGCRERLRTSLSCPTSISARVSGRSRSSPRSLLYSGVECMNLRTRALHDETRFAFGIRVAVQTAAYRSGVRPEQPDSPQQPALWVQGASSDLPVLSLFANS